MKELASLPNVVCKISGVTTEAGSQELDPRTAEALHRACDRRFGFERVMYGGDWHVCELAGPYPQWVEIVDWVIEGASADEKRQLYRDTAIRAYRLDA
jgi:L-fuconolactonase